MARSLRLKLFATEALLREYTREKDVSVSGRTHLAQAFSYLAYLAATKLQTEFVAVTQSTNALPTKMYSDWSPPKCILTGAVCSFDKGWGHC